MFKQKFAIKTLNTILINKEEVLLKLSQDQKLVMLGIMRDNGYILSKDNLLKFLEMDISHKNSLDIIEAIQEIRGSNVQHKTLIGKFPLQDNNQLHRSLVAFVNHLSGIIPQIPDMLIEDKQLYNLDEIGNEIYLDITDDIDDKILQLFTSKIPLSLDHETFIQELYKSKDPIINKVDPNKIILKEILARHIAMELVEKEEISARNAIDIIRAVAILSGEENAKLDNTFKIKGLTNPIRRKIIESLDKVANIDDITSKKNLFKKLFKLLHVHESKYEKYENIRALAKELQTVNNPKTSRTELYKLINGIGTKEGFDLVIGNPSLFIRNLDAILRNHHPDSVLELFKMSLETRDVETKLLLQILEHFRNRDKDLSERMFTPKGKSTPVVVDKELKALEQEVINKLDEIISNELKRQYSKTENFFDKTYIHPDLYKINLPKGLSDQDGMKVMSRGSKYKVQGDGDILRLFVHWKAHVDIDLSALILDSSYNKLSQALYFGNLSGSYWEHSGDVRSAPNGGSEFIDIYLDKVPPFAKYVVMAINCYSGEDYDNIPELFAGVMIRKDKLAGKKFEPKTVEDKFSISGGNDFKSCVLFDIETRELIMMNVNSGFGGFSSIDSTDFKPLIKNILEHKYVTVGEVLELRSNYVLCEDEQLVMSEEELSKVKVFDANYGFNVLDITSNIL